MYIKKISKSEYQLFYKKAGKATFFHSLEWQDIVSTSYKIKMIYLGFFQGERVIGVMPVMSRKIMGLAIYGAPLPKTSTPDNFFPLFNKVDKKKALEAINKWVKENKWNHLQISWQIDKDIFYPQLNTESRTIIEININDSLDLIWKNIKREGRNRIRFALRNNVRVHLHDSDKYIDEYPRLLSYTYEISQGIPPNTSLSFFHELKKIKTKLPLKIFTATHNGLVIAMLWIFFDENRCYYWEGASDATGKKFAANHLLHWEVMKWAQQKGIKHYDMIGGGAARGEQTSKSDGILRFKKSLGAKVIDSKLIYWQSLWIKTLFRGYRMYLLHYKDRPRKYFFSQ